MKKACKVAYFGWYSKYGDYAIGSEILASQNRGMLLDWVFTQQYIWELIDNSDATFLDGDIQNQYISFKNDVDYRMARIKTRPSFDATTIEVEAGETKVINDANGVLADYSTIDNEKDGVRFKHIKGENTLTITIPDTCSKESIKLSDATMKEWGLVKEESKDMDTTIYFALDNGAQDQIYALHYNDPVPLAFELKVNLTGNMSIKKLDSEKNLINGSIFNVTGPNGYNNDVTVVDGKILIEKLRKGTYTIKEKSAPKGYLINENTYTIEVKSNETTEQVVIDTEPTGKISISKTDSKTGTIAQGDSTLKDAVYKVYANEDIYNVAKTKKFYSKGDLVATRNTNDKGICEDVNDLPLGKYIVREEKAPLGYLLDTKQYDVNLSYKDQNTKVITEKVNSTDKVKEMRVHIFKSGIKENSGIVKGLEGAEFTIKLNADVQNAYNQGYTYAEVWNGIDENGNKVSVDSSRVAEAQTIAPTYETIKTDENGNAYTSSLAYGKYIVKETNTPKDFESAADFTFSITKDESEIADIAQKVKDIVVNNEQLESYIKLIKKDKITNKVVTLNNATFQIKATKDIYDRGNGKILYKKGEIIKQKIGSTTFDSFTTNAKNIVVPTNSYTYNKDILGSIMIPLKLEVGSYEITEIKTPTGFLKLENPVTFNVDGIRDYDTDKDGDFVKEVVIKNEQPTGTLNLDKSVAVRENVDTSFIDVSDLSGIQFKLVAKEDIKDMADGSNFYNKGQEICKYCLSKDGKLTIDKLPMGTYELQEIKTLDGLVLDDTKYEVKFTMKDNTTKVYTKELKVKNDTTLVSVSKQDITGQKELEGAKLTVLDNDKVIDTWTSTNKQHTIEGLVVGREYTLREEIAPDGYVKATDIKFTVKNTNEIQHVKMIDKIVTMSKVDIGGEELKVSLAKRIQENFGENLSIYNEYGPTETTVGCMIYKYDVEKDTGYAVPIGVPADNVKLYILDENKNLAYYDCIGELYIGGDGVATGYVNLEELTRERFITNPFITNQSMYKTGDLCRYRSDGTIEYIGRKDNQVKINGFRIELQEIEKSILQISGIKDALVKVNKMNNNTNCLCAYLILSEQVSEEKIKRNLRKILPEYMIPTQYIYMEKFPITSNGKIDSEKLPIFKEKENLFRAPKTENEKILVQMIEQVVEIENVGINQNYFNIGGDSIKAIQIVAKLRELGYELKVKDILTSPIIEEMAMLLKKQKNKVQSSQKYEDGAIQFTPIIKWFFQEKDIVDKNYWNQSVLLEIDSKVSYEMTKNAIIKLINHHDILRLNYNSYENKLFYNNKYLDYNDSIQKTKISYSTETEMREKIKDACEKFKKKMNIQHSICFKTLWIDIGKANNMLLLTANHLVIDGISWRILLDDFRRLLMKQLKGEESILPIKTSSYKEWSEHLNCYISSFIPTKLAYWKECDDVVIPYSKNNKHHWSKLENSLSENDTKKFLYNFNNDNNLEQDEILLIALGLTLQDMYNTEEKFVVEVEGHGREEIFDDIDLTRTVGWFTIHYPILFSNLQNNLEKDIITLKDEIRTSKKNAFEYMILKYKNELEDKGNKKVRFNYMGDMTNGLANNLFTISQYEHGNEYSVNNGIGCSVEINAMILYNKLIIKINYNDLDISSLEVQKLARTYINKLHEILDIILQNKICLISQSDYQDIELSKDEFDSLFQ